MFLERQSVCGGRRGYKEKLKPAVLRQSKLQSSRLSKPTQNNKHIGFIQRKVGSCHEKTC